MKKILLLRPGAMGDVCMALPLVQALQEHCEVHWLLRRHYQPLPALFPSLRVRTIALDLCREPPVIDAPRYPQSLVSQLKEERYDALLDLSHWPEMSRLAYDLASIPLRAIAHDPVQDTLLQVNPQGFDLYAPFNFRVPVADGQHQVEKWRALIAAALGLNLTPRWPLPTRLPHCRPLRLMIHPHAGKPAKLWSVGGYVHVLTRLARSRRIECLINSGGRPEWPRAVALWGWLQAHGIRSRVLFRDRSYRRLAATLQRADLALGSDSGPMHFASLLGVPTICLYGPYSAREFSPRWGSIAVEPRPRGQDARAIEPSTVLAALERCLDGLPRKEARLGRAA